MQSRLDTIELFQDIMRSAGNCDNNFKNKLGAVLLSGGTKGKRFVLPHSTVMLHQALGGIKEQSSDVDIEAAELHRTKDILNGILSRNCGKDLEEIVRATDRNFYLHGREAVEYGVANKVMGE